LFVEFATYPGLQSIQVAGFEQETQLLSLQARHEPLLATKPGLQDVQLFADP